MSTRCNIIVKENGKKVVLYHHHDGYIEGVGADLFNRFNERFSNPNSCVYWDDVVNELVKDAKDEYEVTSGIHGDIEYLYTIDTKKKTIKMNPIEINWETHKVVKKKAKDVLKVFKERVKC